MRRSVSYLLISLAIVPIASCTSPSTSSNSGNEYYQPHPPAWFIGTWQGESETKEYHYTFTVGTNTLKKDVMHVSPETSSGMVASTITFYHGFNGKYLETLGDNLYELRPENRSATFERFSVNASGSIDYTFGNDGSATQSIVLEKQ